MATCISEEPNLILGAVQEDKLHLHQPSGTFLFSTVSFCLSCTNLTLKFGVRPSGVGAGVGHVHFMFFVLISFAFCSRRKPSFQWNMGFKGLPMGSLGIYIGQHEEKPWSLTL